MLTENPIYPIIASPVVGSAPMSPPTTLTDIEQYSTDCGSHLFNDIRFSKTSYNSSASQDSYSKFDKDDTNNNNSNYSAVDDDFFGDSISPDFCNLSVCNEESAPTTLGASTPVETKPLAPVSKRSKKVNRSKSKSSTSSEDSASSNSRKDSFVYDVRIPDEQFLFFVPDLDLVKSHLMFAVREEVDVLKDKIVELMDRINHLEVENSVLRQYASQEVLQQIQTQIPHQIQQPSHHSSTS